MSKPRILVAVLSGSERDRWISSQLFEGILALQLDGRMSILVTTSSIDRYEVARNSCVRLARDMQADFLVMVDNDMVLPMGFPNILYDVTHAAKPIVGFPSARINHDGSISSLTPHDNGEKDGEFQRTGHVGSGLLILSSEVWRVMPRGPWFRWLTNDDELLSRKLSEDYAFCELAQAHGLQVWSHQSTAGHLKTSDITRRQKGAI